VATAEKRVTIVDVARRAGVSIGTVSRVLNNASCAAATRERVKEAVASLNYVPNHAAQSLKRQTTEQIALVIPDIANPVYVAMSKAVQQTAKSRGYRLVLVSTDENASEEEHALRSLEQRHADGLILCSLKPNPKLLKLVTHARQNVCVIGYLPDEAPVDNVRVDSASGAAMAVQHLIDQGRSRIGFINGTAGTVPAASRSRGFERALFDNRIPIDPELVVHADFTMTGGYRVTARLLEAEPGIDALFCANDVIALGAMRRLRELGRDVPGEIAVVGMDDIELGKVSTPTLTSVTLLASERGRIAAELLLERIKGGTTPDEPRKVTVMPRLIVRESSTDYIRPGPGGTDGAT
jgi:LacI family transcriptional regulator